MTPVWLVVRAGLRARWRTWLVLAVLTGLAGGLLCGRLAWQFFTGQLGIVGRHWAGRGLVPGRRRTGADGASGSRVGGLISASRR
jgi:hypothetical protein